MSRSPRAVALLASVACTPVAAFAQTTDTTFIGSILIGESRRGVQTETATSETVIDQDELDARQGATLGELIDTVPGVTLVNGATPQGSSISIRGLGSQSGTYGSDGKVSVVVDGVAKGAEEIYRNGGMLTMEPELFKEVTVLRGPGESFRYASGAMGGTVEAQTKDASDFLEGDDTFAFRQKFGYESNGDGLLTTSILAWKPTDRVEILGFAGYRSVGDRTDGAGDDQIDTAFDMPSAMLKGKVKLGDFSSLTAFYSYNENPENDVYYNAFNPGSLGTLVDRTTTDKTSYLSYNYAPGGLIDTTVRLTYSEEEMKITSDDTSSDIYNADHLTKRLALTVENTARFDTGMIGHELLTGVEVGKRTREAIDTATGLNAGSAPGGDDDYVAAYISDKITLGRLTLTPQIRYEQQTLTSDGNDFAYGSFTASYPAIADGTEFRDAAWTGALSARYAITDAFAVFGTVAYNENLPILDDLRDTTFSHQSEKGVTREVGLSFDQVALLTADDALRAKLTGYETRIWDGTTYSNIDDVTIKGVELELSYVTGDWYGDFNGSWAEGEVTDWINGASAASEDYFKWVPAHSARFTLGRRLMNDQLDLSGEVLHAWAQSRTTDTNAAYYPGTIPTDAYTVYGVSAAYTPDEGALAGYEFRVAVENLFDETYKPYLSTRNATGRNFKLSVAKTF